MFSLIYSVVTEHYRIIFSKFPSLCQTEITMVSKTTVGKVSILTCRWGEWLDTQSDVKDSLKFGEVLFLEIYPADIQVLCAQCMNNILNADYADAPAEPVEEGAPATLWGHTPPTTHRCLPHSKPRRQLGQ